jgi:hypothetical protein
MAVMAETTKTSCVNSEIVSVNWVLKDFKTIIEMERIPMATLLQTQFMEFESGQKV